MLWSVASPNFRCMSILEVIQMHHVQQIYRIINLQVFTKRCICGGNCITGSVEGGLGNVKTDGADIKMV
jgi:hypothetical protein